MFSHWLSSDQDELFKFISAPCEQQSIMQQGKLLVNVNPSLFNNAVEDHSATNTTKPKTSGKRKLCAFDNMEESPKDYIKKMIHRDVERQRRLEMAGVYQNMRSIIPPQHLEGKRSISDQIDGTTKYIRYKKDKIEKLNKKKIELQELLPAPSPLSKVVENRSSEGYGQPRITFKTCRTGTEIAVNVGIKGDFPLSKILSFLVSEGMSIKSCISTRVNERQLHIIQSEASEEKNVDTNQLYKKLMETVRNQQATIK